MCKLLDPIWKFVLSVNYESIYYVDIDSFVGTKRPIFIHIHVCIYSQ